MSSVWLSLQATGLGVGSLLSGCIWKSEDSRSAKMGAGLPLCALRMDQNLGLNPQKSDMVDVYGT